MEEFNVWLIAVGCFVAVYIINRVDGDARTCTECRRNNHGSSCWCFMSRIKFKSRAIQPPKPDSFAVSRRRYPTYPNPSTSGGSNDFH